MSTDAHELAGAFYRAGGLYSYYVAVKFRCPAYRQDFIEAMNQGARQQVARGLYPDVLSAKKASVRRLRELAEKEPEFTNPVLSEPLTRFRKRVMEQLLFKWDADPLTPAPLNQGLRGAE